MTQLAQLALMHYSMCPYHASVGYSGPDDAGVYLTDQVWLQAPFDAQGIPHLE